MKRGLLVAAATLCAVELIFGQWLGPNYGSLGIPRHFDRLFDVRNLYANGGIAHVTTDENGLRGDFGAPDQIRLLVMGNGTVFEQYVDDAQTMPARLGARFAEAGCPRPTAASGLNGQSTRGMIRRFDEWFPLIPGLKPQAVLIYVGSNEDLTEAQDMADTGRPPTAWKRFTQVLANNSALARWGNTALRHLRPLKPTPIGEAGSAPQWGEIAAKPPLPPMNSAYYAPFGARLAQLVERVKAMGALPIIATQHAGWYFEKEGKLFGVVENGQPTAPRLEEARLQARATMEACRTTGALCIDVVDGMMPAQGDFYDHVHTAPAGDQHIADFLFPRIRGALGCQEPK
ncbi:Lysophospholipase L1 [Paramagnetospirillum magnetotacticum MS-1]|uniref:Lysophospholipase L1 n=1 Tax=Paramagnetospirillum magnetotacticum MS-1 TaxID=272627 RepID=A0A0C2YER1_PARME|nr:GDSL-type esterase/lipase family protein [Paramagnetospirillum magnetotacticum]KIL98194.1 Lysophospholipase L1 [Paramagnetospirillum magnetotacticum MS-1]